MKTTQELISEVLAARKRGVKGTAGSWQCLECGKRMSAKSAEKAAFGSGCTRCGGTDIDLA